MPDRSRLAARSWAGSSIHSACRSAHALRAGYSSDTAAVLGAGLAGLLLLLVLLLDLLGAFGMLPDARSLSSLYAGATT
jgi:threonine dehydrogenase-like Zn-dependent dehydrogenase